MLRIQSDDQGHEQQGGARFPPAHPWEEPSFLIRHQSQIGDPNVALRHDALV